MQDDELIEDACDAVHRVVCDGGHLEEALRALASFTLDGRGHAVFEAEQRSQRRAETDPTWGETAAVLRHALDTGLFHPRNRSGP